MQKDLVFKEESYLEMMENVAEPFLKERSKEFFLKREKGRELYCIKYQVENPKGVVLISHGFTESAEKYKEICYYFVKENYHVYIPEHCGHGKSYRLTKDFSLVHVDHYERYVRDLLFVAMLAKKENQNLPLFLYAHSMGGGIGAAVAARKPELFAKMILTSPMIRPLTGKIPWGVARAISAGLCFVGREMAYVSGQPYAGKETFEDSCSLSRARFDYYQEKRDSKRELQTCAASFGWLRESGKLNAYLRKEAVKNIHSPVILFQAEQETMVSKKVQSRFIDALKSRGVNAELISVENARHEIFNAEFPVLEKYWEQVFEFLDT
ncbi:alpha/beta hydrolase [Roseburia hominis]